MSTLPLRFILKPQFIPSNYHHNYSFERSQQWRRHLQLDSEQPSWCWDVSALPLFFTLLSLMDSLSANNSSPRTWMAATLIDFYINILAIAVWIVYKEANWIWSIIWIVLLICLGSITTCVYIVLQFLMLSPQESIQDPIYFVLLRNRKRNETESKSVLSILSARILFSVLGCLMLGTLVYTLATDGSPFCQENLTP
ncbi:hypothetical protein ACS0TY_013549 [Phlomoides rotata]